jgi:dTMP kinase
VTSPPYIALEGAEGSGKTTQAALLAEALGAVVTRETGATAVGKRLRQILHDNDVTELDARAEALIAAADRAQHFAEVVLPALREGRTIVSDRSVYSTLAYQGFGRRLPLDEIRHINDWAIRGRWPDLVVLIEVPEEQLARRMRHRELDRFEREDGQFHRRVAEGFREMAAADPAVWVVVDGDRPRDQVAGDIRGAIRERLGL